MSLIAWLAAAAVVALATVVQAGTGMGFGLVAVPLLVLVAPELGIGAILAITVVVMLAVAWGERAWIAPRDVAITSAAAVPGILVGTAVARVTPAATMQVAVGVVVALASGLALVAWRVRTSATTVAIGGALGGVLTPIAALPGPPMAITYRPADVRTMRSTLSSYFAVTSVLALAALALTPGGGSTSALGADALHGLALIPAVLVGAVAATPVVRRLPEGFVRTAALTLSLISGVVLAARGVMA